MRPAVKRVLYKVHKWTALTLGIFLVVQAASGLVLQYKPELNGLLYPVPGDGAILDADTLVEAARSALPGTDLDRLIFPDEPPGAVLVRADLPEGGRRFAAIDPYTGELIAAGGLLRFPTEAALFLHHDLFLGVPGMLVIGTFGLAALTLTITGLILWWPGAGRIRRSLRITLKPPAIRYLYDLHKSPGVLLAILILPVVVTGTGIAFRPQLAAVLDSFFEMQPPPALAPGDTPASDGSPELAALLARAREAADGKNLKDLRFAGRDDRLLGILFWADEAADDRAVDQVWFDRLSGERLDVVYASKRKPASRFLDWLLPIHTGEFAGAIGRALATVAGIGLLLVGVTGLWLWWERHKLRRGRR